MTKLSKIEKQEMFKDGRSKKRMIAFRKAKNSSLEMSFEEYVEWLQQVLSLTPEKYSDRKRKFVVYKNVKI
ncbi:MAG: hypothetical protein BWY26_00024 [Elusimicrobia bacterium ADurb.Bin231]|nr:MAG: hypothetical protein BWY26_00024 [Elusimicrobia bacterium ADurb.Bin231]